MPSYQDIEQRLKTLEHKIDFAMRTMRMQAMVTNGVLDANGQPQGKVFNASLLEMYHLSNQLPPAPAAAVEDHNGSALLF